MFVICNCSLPPPLPSYEDALKIVPRPLDIEKEKDAFPPPKYSLVSEENIYSITPMSTSTINITAQQEENQHRTLPSTAS